MAKQSCAFVVVNGQTVGIPEELRQELEKNRIPEQAMASVVRMVAPPTTSQSDVSFSAWLGNTLSSGATRLELYAGDDGFISAKAVIDYLKFFKAKVAAKTNIYFPDSNNTYSAEFSRKVLDSIGANLIIGMLNAEISPYELIEDQSKYPKLFSDSLATALDDLRYAKEYYESIGKTASLEYDQITKFISDAYNNPFVVDAFFKTHLDKKGIRSKQLGNLVFVTDDQLTDIETTKEIQEDSEDASTKKDGLSGLDSFERDKLNNAPFAVELLFSLMPSQVGKDETGKLVSYRDELYGLRVGGNVAKLKAFVAENLANKPANGDILMYELEKHLTEQKDSDDQWASIVLDFLNMPYNNEQQRLDRVKLLQEFTQFATNHDQAFSTDIMAADGSISRISDTIDNNVHRFIRSTRTAREVFRTSRSLSSHEHQAELIKLSSKVSSGMANDEDYLELLKSLGYVKLDFNDTSVLYKSYAEATKNLPQANNLKEFLENTAQYINRGLSKDFNIARPDNLKSSKAITDLITKYKSEIYKKSKVLGSIFIPETFKAIKHHLTPERKQKHNINRKSFLTDYSDYLIYIAKELVEDEAFNTKAEAREALIDFLPELADPILNTSVILDSVLEAMVNKDFEKYGFTVDSLSGVMDRTESIGVGTDFDHLNEQLVLQSYVKSIEENSLHLPRTADRGMEYFVRLHPGTQFELGKDDTSTEAHLEKVVIDFVVALQEANKAGTDYSKYSWGDKAKTNLRFFEFLVSQEERNALGLKGAAPFKLADFLTAGVKETTSGLTFTNAALASKVRSAISEFIQNEQTKFLDYAFALGVGKPKRNSTAVAGIPLEYYNAFRKTEFDPKTATALVLKRVANGMIISFLETSRFFAGDPIAFKDSDEFFKRLALLNATKKSSTTSKELKTFLVETVPNSRHARLNKNKPTQEYINRLNDDSLTTLVLENEFSNLEQRDFETYVGLEEAIKDALNSLGVSSEQAVRQTLANTIEKYKNAESADAMGYITLDSYRRLQLKEGSWNNEKEALYKRLVRGVEVSTAEVLNKFSVLKPQGYGKVGQELNKNISTARKLALFPLIPQVLEPGSKLAILEEYMSREGIDIATYPSGIKFGYSKPVNLNNLEEGGKDAVDVTSYNDFGVQVDIYAKEEDLTAESVQKAKNIYANSYAAGVPVNESKVDLLEKYTELRNLLVQRRLKDFLTEVIKMNEESVGTFDLSRIAEDLIKTATELQYSPAELEFMSLSLNKGYIDFDSSSSMVENMVVSSFRNKVIRNKRPGYSSPQVSNVGFKKESSNLRFYRKSKISEELLPMEFITTIPSSIEQWAKKEFGDNYLNILNRKIAKENKLFNEYHEGKISEEEYTLKSDKLIDNLVKVIGFRIPNQGPNSSEYMRVVEFLPSIYDGVAMAAMEIVVKTGSDFDIDKLNLYFPTIDKGGSIQRIDFLSQAQKIAAKEIKELFSGIKPVLFKNATKIKQGVSELFESNPELANAVYEALGLIDTSEIQLDKPRFNSDNFEATSYPIKINRKYAGVISVDKDGYISSSIGMAGIELEKEFQGKGYGTKVYIALAEQLAKEGKTLKSEAFGKQDINEAANRVWKSLLDKGYAVDKGTYFEIQLKDKQQAQQLYSQYLDTIFPDSKVKDIVYHNTDEQFDKFRTTPVAKFFTKSSVKGRKYRIPVLLNTFNPKIFNEFTEDDEMTYGLAEIYAKNKEKDGIINGTEGKTRTEYIVFEPDQIHTLGSEQDIKRFKEFAAKTNLEGLKLAQAALLTNPTPQSNTPADLERSVQLNLIKQELLDFIIEENNKKTDAGSSMIDTIVYKTINNASSEELAAMLSNDSTVVVATEEDKMILPDEVSLSKEIRYFINGYKAKRKLDRVVELLMDNKVLLNRIGQDAIENELFFTEYEAMQPTSAQDIADFLLPLGTDTIKKVVNKIRKAKGISTSTGTGYGLNISPANNLKKFSSFLSSGAGIGIAAIHLANHPMGQRADLKVFDYGFNLIGKGAKFSENNMVSFGQIYDVDNSSIINNVSEILNAFLDIVKDDFPIDANLTEKSASIAIMMIRSGMSPNDVLTFMSQPIVVEYFKTLSNISKGRSRVPAYFVLERMFSERGKSLDNMKNMHNLVVTKKDYEKLHERIGQAKSIAEAGYLVRLSTSELDAGLSTPLADILTDKTQINVLKQFLILEKTAGAFGGWVSTQAPDSKGFKDTAQLENQNIIENYFEGSIIMSVDRSVKLPTSAHKQAKQIITPILKSTKLSSFYDPTGELDLLKDAVRKDFDLSKDEKDKRINEIDRLFVKFVTTVKLKDANIIDLSYKSKDYNRLTTGVASVPNRLLKLKKVLDSYGISNGFLDRAIFNLGEGNGGADIISLDIVNSDRYAVRSIVDGLQTFSDNRAYYQGLVKSSGYEFSVGALFEDLVYYSFLISDPLDPSTQISRFIPAADRFNLIYDYIDPNLASTLDYSDYGKTFVTLLTKEVDKFSGLKTNKNYYLTGTHGLVLPAASTLSKEKTKVITEANIKKAEEIRKTCMGL